eukprot:TRINITY_DN13220_c0_g1_i1.p1 TRINITY_DN13220_c0_g1~~TRINITY_DN13220_c0_g1_i1.p1  ORF type:complete len:495 (+),score=91.95 TRINITY_DN13220_c0_g1_i1:212-1486(+)
MYQNQGRAFSISGFRVRLRWWHQVFSRLAVDLDDVQHAMKMIETTEWFLRRLDDSQYTALRDQMPEEVAGLKALISSLKCQSEELLLKKLLSSGSQPCGGGSSSSSGEANDIALLQRGQGSSRNPGNSPAQSAEEQSSEDNPANSPEQVAEEQRSEDNPAKSSEQLAEEHRSEDNPANSPEQVAEEQRSEDNPANSPEQVAEEQRSEDNPANSPEQVAEEQRSEDNPAKSSEQVAEEQRSEDNPANSPEQVADERRSEDNPANSLEQVTEEQRSEDNSLQQAARESNGMPAHSLQHSAAHDGDDGMLSLPEHRSSDADIAALVLGLSLLGGLGFVGGAVLSMKTKVFSLTAVSMMSDQLSRGDMIFTASSGVACCIGSGPWIYEVSVLGQNCATCLQRISAPFVELERDLVSFVRSLVVSLIGS